MSLVVCELTADHERLANSGSPMGRRRAERIARSLLGIDDGPIRMPLVLRVGLAFGRKTPVTAVERLLKAARLRTPDEARAFVSDRSGGTPLPTTACLCRASTVPLQVPLDFDNPTEALFHAVVLGLSTPHYYDPSRPMVWTEASLTRTLDLFVGEGFYA